MKQMFAIRLKPGSYPPPLAAGMYVRENFLPSEISFSSDLQRARTWESYQEAYRYLDDNLYGMADVVKVASTQSDTLNLVDNAVIASELSLKNEAQLSTAITLDASQIAKSPAPSSKQTFLREGLITSSTATEPILQETYPKKEVKFLNSRVDANIVDEEISPTFLSENNINSIVSPPTTGNSKKSRIKVLFWSLISLAITVGVGGGILAMAPCSVNDKRVWGSCYRDLQAKPLTIGIASTSPEEDYNVLAAHLRYQLGSFVEIDKYTTFEDVPDRIASKDWDIAFTRSPIFSIAAEDNRYIGVAIMFPDQPPYYQAALYVRSDSPIESIADITSTTTIALGSPDSAPTFQMPIYTLYGKSLRVGIGYRPKDVVEMVKAGIVDVGASRYAAVKDDPALKIIYISKDIPGAGVYLSPKLSSTDRTRIKDALLNAPPDIQALASYGTGKIPKYDELRKIIFKTEKILSCPTIKINSFDLQKPVNLFCEKQTQEPNIMEGPITPVVE